jgi:hypothetical protein
MDAKLVCQTLGVTLKEKKQGEGEEANRLRNPL